MRLSHGPPAWVSISLAGIAALVWLCREGWSGAEGTSQQERAMEAWLRRRAAEGTGGMAVAAPGIPGSDAGENGVAAAVASASASPAPPSTIPVDLPYLLRMKTFLWLDEEASQVDERVLKLLGVGAEDCAALNELLADVRAKLLEQEKIWSHEVRAVDGASALLCSSHGGPAWIEGAFKRDAVALLASPRAAVVADAAFERLFADFKEERVMRVETSGGMLSLLTWTRTDFQAGRPPTVRTESVERGLARYVESRYRHLERGRASGDEVKENEGDGAETLQVKLTP